MRWCWWW